MIIPNRGKCETDLSTHTTTFTPPNACRLP